MNRNFKQEIKDWWSENKRVVKVGSACLLIGAFWGFVKGVNSMTSLSVANSKQEEDDFVHDELSVDDPELLELIRMEEENS